MVDLIKYLKEKFGINKPGEVTWSHAVNSKEKLGRFLNKPGTMIIESDIRISSKSDLTFEELITQMQGSSQGLKLDFKDPEILVPCLQHLKEVALSQPILLNADILQGNGANPPKFSAGEFLAQCRKYYPSGLLSIGWTTTANPELGYTEQNIMDMLQLCQGVEQATFPVRACLLPSSWEQLTKLIVNDGYTLTVWNNEPVSEELKKWIKENTDPQKTFYDFIIVGRTPRAFSPRKFIDDNKDPLKL